MIADAVARRAPEFRGVELSDAARAERAPRHCSSVRLPACSCRDSDSRSRRSARRRGRGQPRRVSSASPYNASSSTTPRTRGPTSPCCRIASAARYLRCARPASGCRRRAASARRRARHQRLAQQLLQEAPKAARPIETAGMTLAAHEGELRDHAACRAGAVRRWRTTPKPRARPRPGDSAPGPTPPAPRRSRCSRAGTRPDSTAAWGRSPRARARENARRVLHMIGGVRVCSVRVDRPRAARRAMASPTRARTRSRPTARPAVAAAPRVRSTARREAAPGARSPPPTARAWLGRDAPAGVACVHAARRCRRPRQRRGARPRPARAS